MGFFDFLKPRPRVEAKDWSKTGSVFTRNEVDAIIRAHVPNLALPPGRPYHWDDEYRSPGDWGWWSELFARVPLHRPYRKRVGDCDKIAKRLVVLAAEEWDKMGGDLPLPMGVIGGNVPNDSAGPRSPDTEGWHALAWFIEPGGDFYLYGAQERSVKPRHDLARIHRAEELAIGG